MEDKGIAEPRHQRRLAVEMLFFTPYLLIYREITHSVVQNINNILWNVFVYILYIFTIILIMLSYLIIYISLQYIFFLPVLLTKLPRTFIDLFFSHYFWSWLINLSVSVSSGFERAPPVGYGAVKTSKTFMFTCITSYLQLFSLNCVC